MWHFEGHDLGWHMSFRSPSLHSVSTTVLSELHSSGHFGQKSRFCYYQTSACFPRLVSPVRTDHILTARYLYQFEPLVVQSFCYDLKLGVLAHITCFSVCCCCCCPQGVALFIVPWNAESILWALPIFYGQHLHVADQPRFVHQPCKY